MLGGREGPPETVEVLLPSFKSPQETPLIGGLPYAMRWLRTDIPTTASAMMVVDLGLLDSGRKERADWAAFCQGQR